jgi:rSAM/selenodomain-associated transferase 2
MKKLLISPSVPPLEKGEKDRQGDNFSAAEENATADADFANPLPKPVISLILPVLNEAPILAGVLSGLPQTPDLEILLVDGGSTDATRAVAAGFPHVRCLTAPRGRGAQMNAGARMARGDFFLFLHIDTVLTTDHLTALRRAAADPRVGAGAFELRLHPPTPFLRFIAWGANWRCRLFHLPYGDQAIFVRRDLFAALGGYTHRRPEDLDLVIRLRRFTRLRLLTPPVSSSGRRWLEHGNLRTTTHHWLFLIRHLAERRFTRRWGKMGNLFSGGGQGLVSLALPPHSSSLGQTAAAGGAQAGGAAVAVVTQADGPGGQGGQVKVSNGPGEALQQGLVQGLVEVAVEEASVPGDADQSAAHERGHGGRVKA